MPTKHPLPEGRDPIVIRRNWDIINDNLGKIKVSENDTTPGYLEDKLVTETPWLDDEVLNEGGNEQLSHRHMDAASEFDDLHGELLAAINYLDQDGRLITEYFYSNTHARLEIDGVSPSPSPSPSGSS